MTHTFVILPVSDRSGKKLQPARIPIADIADYRNWLNERTGEDNKQAVLFFYSKRPRIVIDMSVEELDEAIGPVLDLTELVSKTEG